MSLRDEVCRANRMLTELGLVVMHSGNVSGIDRDADVVFIKPSGVDYDALTPEAIVPIRFSTGEPLELAWKPSVDLVHHLELYRRMPEVGAIVHTHSNYATAFAACERPIPPVLTAIADEFGGAIPCTPYVANEGTQIAEAILGARGSDSGCARRGSGRAPRSAWRVCLGTDAASGDQGRRDGRGCREDGLACAPDRISDSFDGARDRGLVGSVPLAIRAGRVLGRQVLPRS